MPTKDKDFSVLISTLQTQSESMKAETNRLKNIEKLNSTLAQKNISLSKEQTDSVKALKRSLESNDLANLEVKQESNERAMKTLELLGEIVENTEANQQIDFSSIASKIGLAVGAAIATTGLSSGAIAGIKDVAMVSTKTKTLAALIKAVRITFNRAFEPMIRFIKNTKLAFEQGRALDAKRIVGFTKAFNGAGFGRGFLSTKNGPLRVFYKIGELTTQVSAAFGKVFADVANASRDLKNALGVYKGNKFLQPLFRFLNTTKQALPKFFNVFKAIGRILGRFTGILTVAFAIFDTIKGAMKAWKDSEGENVIARITKTLFGGIGEFFAGLAGGLLDFIKDIGIWVFDKLGLDGVANYLRKVEFAQTFRDMFNGLANLLTMIPEMLGRMLSAGVEGFKALLKGKNPIEAFAAAFSGDSIIESKRKEYAKESKSLSNVRVKIYDLENQGTLSGRDKKNLKMLKVQESSILGEIKGIGAEIQKAKNNTMGARLQGIINETKNANMELQRRPQMPAVVDASNVVSNQYAPSVTMNSSGHIDRTLNLAY
jgi:hypothetical protein